MSAFDAPPVPGPGTARPLNVASRHARTAGALLGVHAGDALGAGLEFEPWSEIAARHPGGPRRITGGGPFEWAAGQATEDVDLTRAVLLAYLDHRRDPSLDVVHRAAERMLEWYEGSWPGRRRGEHPRDVAIATRAGLTRFRSSADPYTAGAGAGHAGNGSLTRCLPSALVRPKGAGRTAEAMQISAITHNDPRCTLSCAAYVDAAGALIAGATVADAIDTARATVLAQAVEPAAPGEVIAAIDHAMHLSLPDIVSSGRTEVVGHGSGYVLDTLMLGIAAVRDPRPFPEVIVDVVRVGGDTDTNAAVAGGLLGARDGLDAIPREWLEVLEYRLEFLDAARALASDTSS